MPDWFFRRKHCEEEFVVVDILKLVSTKIFVFFANILVKSCTIFSSSYKFLLFMGTFFVAFNSLPPLCGASTTKDAARLFEDLLADYNKLVRPVDTNNETLVVKF